MNKKEFKPHMMYHPKTGKGTKASTYEQHLKLKKMGYGHDKQKRNQLKRNQLRRRVKPPSPKL
jgi:hypothetical protein